MGVGVHGCVHADDLVFGVVYENAFQPQRSALLRAPGMHRAHRGYSTKPQLRAHITRGCAGKSGAWRRAGCARELQAMLRELTEWEPDLPILFAELG